MVSKYVLYIKINKINELSLNAVAMFLSAWAYIHLWSDIFSPNKVSVFGRDKLWRMVLSSGYIHFLFWGYH